MNLFDSPTAGKVLKHIISAGKVVEESALPEATRNLVLLRASQINGGVTDDVWANAAKHYDDEQLIALASTIAIINAFNRLNVFIQHPAGDYQPGQFG